MSSKQRGYSLIEMMVSVTVIVVVMAAIFQLLSQTQSRYTTTASVEEATAMVRDSLDGLIREMRLAGYPPPSSYPCPPPAGATYGACLTNVNSGYVAGGIMVGSPYAAQFEADTDADGLVEVIDYELQVPTGWAAAGCAGLTGNSDLTTPTLMRSIAEKDAAGAVPAVDLEPYLENVRNCDLNQAIFTYCPAPPTAAPAGCPTMSNYGDSALAAPRNTRVVLIDLQVQMAVSDPQTGAFHNVEQFGMVERVNPD